MACCCLPQVQLDIRQGHAQTVDKVLRWLDEGEHLAAFMCQAGARSAAHCAAQVKCIGDRVAQLCYHQPAIDMRAHQPFNSVPLHLFTLLQRVAWWALRSATRAAALEASPFRLHSRQVQLPVCQGSCLAFSAMHAEMRPDG